MVSFKCDSYSVMSYVYQACAKGPIGLPGPPGPPGPNGGQGEGELLSYNNWKQCAWYSANGNDYDTIYVSKA